MTRVVLVDDQDLVRAGVRALLEHDSDIEVVGEAGDGNSAYTVTRHVHPDVVLMDIRMPVCDGITATRRITGDSVLAAVRVVMLTTFGDEDNLFAALRAGASGFLLKDSPAAQLRRAVHVVAQGDALLDAAVTKGVIEAAVRVKRPGSGQHLAALTSREREVLQHVALGENNAEIARALFISPDTARTYVSRILTKLHARDRSQLVIIAYEAGLVCS